MNDPLEHQTVADYILESEANLKVAVHMARVFPEVRRQIVVSVLDDLEKKLQETLGSEWEIYNTREEVFVSRYSGFTVSRASWGDVYISLEYAVREEFVALGVWRDRNAGDMAALDTSLVEAFTQAGLAGDSNRFWAWWQPLPAERGNWNDTPALAGMHLHRTEFVDYLADQILQIHRIASPVIDRHFPAG